MAVMQEILSMSDNRYYVNFMKRRMGGVEESFVVLVA
jgi:hypothetical protein